MASTTQDPPCNAEQGQACVWERDQDSSFVCASVRRFFNRIISRGPEAPDKCAHSSSFWASTLANLSATSYNARASQNLWPPRRDPLAPHSFSTEPPATAARNNYYRISIRLSFAALYITSPGETPAPRICGNGVTRGPHHRECENDHKTGRRTAFPSTRVEL